MPWSEHRLLKASENWADNEYSEMRMEMPDRIGAYTELDPAWQAGSQTCCTEGGQRPERAWRGPTKRTVSVTQNQGARGAGPPKRREQEWEWGPEDQLRVLWKVQPAGHSSPSRPSNRSLAKKPAYAAKRLKPTFRFCSGPDRIGFGSGPMCRVGKWNLSYASLTSPEALAGLRGLRTTNPALHEALTCTSAPDPQFSMMLKRHARTGRCTMPVTFLLMLWLTTCYLGGSAVATNFAVAKDGGISRSGSAEASEDEDGDEDEDEDAAQKSIFTALKASKIYVFTGGPSSSHRPNLFSSRVAVTHHVNIWSK
ncbi:hypothetical protein C8R45DRAFT_924177 [Mycena sanguinolenta]|nr:hypothetical protein C8R45DRAFT_924177 [Mycena sanguinolenta]